MKPLLLDPPRVEFDPDLAWLLRTGFESPLPDGVPRNEAAPRDEERTVRLARTLQVSGRIGRQLELSRAIPSGRALRRELATDYRTNVATASLLMCAQRELCQLGERLAVPVIPLKFAALHAARICAPGSRQVWDLDVLVPKASARFFWNALIDAGYRRTNTSEYEHQLEPLLDANGVVVDLHVHIPGVFVEARHFATADELLRRALLIRGPDANYIPNNAILAAHAIAHGLLQNRSTPQTHSPLRMIADLMDLRRVEPAVLAFAKPHLAAALAPTCDTLERLCATLANGTFVDKSFDGTPEQILLWHCLAARLDFEYSERLRAAGLSNKIRDGASLREIAGYLATLLYPGEAELEVLYGPAIGSAARMRRRFRRPLDLARRATRRWARRR